VIEWRPIYKLYLKIHNINDNSLILAPDNLEGSSFGSFIPYARIYFEISATREMLEEWRQLMCPVDVTMSQAFERFRLFLSRARNRARLQVTINRRQNLFEIPSDLYK